MVRNAHSIITVLALLCLVSPVLARDISGPPGNKTTVPNSEEQNSSGSDISVQIELTGTNLKAENENNDLKTDLYLLDTGNGKNAYLKKSGMVGSTPWIWPNVTNLTQTLGSGLQKTYEHIILFFYKLTAANCRETHGQMGGVWYRFWESHSNHASQLDDKTIAKAIHAVLRNVGGVWTRDAYCITITYGYTWVGSLLIGAGPRAMRQVCDGRYHGNYDLIYGRLASPYGGGTISWIKQLFSE
ncbi:hypothetical protein HF325_006740 [Metschnikowia pulcherrima]|uniref:Secreted protein CSS2 C-terminal domain-containing protein n=1 Tax=Metschnikowia pulcherrima TaxID=27326 RepID=A0A8H7GLD2_9ASCO|nr:hypothetical protein HF325_006740 [Metschnikowia pulcherrima]